MFREAASSRILPAATLIGARNARIVPLGCRAQYTLRGLSETPENPALAELLGKIFDRRVRRKVQKLMRFGEEAVRSLGELDTALYQREGGEEQLQVVADAVMSHVRRLLEFLGMVAASVEKSSELAPPDNEIQFHTEEFLEEGATIVDATTPTPPPSNDSGASAGESEEEAKWRALCEEMDSLQYALGSEIKDFDRRFAEALAHDRREQAVGDLNDATNSLMDGVFAVLTTVYECFLGYAEPDRMIPGHRDTLGKALAVRRGLAALRREVQHLNPSVQNKESTPELVQTSTERIVELLIEFIGEDVFGYLRGDDRGEFANFRDMLQQDNGAQRRQASEGLEKYLDSLAVVSQRGVLIKHDTDLRAKIDAELKRAISYAKLLPDIVAEAIHQAFLKSDRLFGLNEELDTLVLKWSSLSEVERNDVREALTMGGRLRDLVKPPESTPAPDASNFF